MTVPADHVAAVDRLVGALRIFLVDERRTLHDGAPRRRDDQLSGVVNRQPRLAAERQVDGVVRRTRRDDEVVFELLLIAVVHEVHSRVDVGVLNAFVSR